MSECLADAPGLGCFLAAVPAEQLGQLVADIRGVQVEGVEVVRACPAELEAVARAVIEGFRARQDGRAADISDEVGGRGAAVVLAGPQQPADLAGERRLLP